MRNTKLFSYLVAGSVAFASVNGADNQEAANAAKEGMAASQAKDWNKAVGEFKKAAGLDEKYAPNLYAALQQRGAMSMSQRKFPEAVSDYSDALKIKADADTLERRAYVYMQMKDYDKALGDYDQAIKMEPKDPKHYLLRSYIYEVKGDIKNGLADCDTVLKLQAGNEEAMSRKMRLQKRAEIGAQPTPPPVPKGPLANPALHKQGAAGAPPAATAKP